MLYCPKCQHTYETGSQRFCSNDNTRLLLAPSPGKGGKMAGGVFSSILGRADADTDAKNIIGAPPKFVEFEQPQPSIPEFIQPEISKNFTAEPENLLELEIDVPEALPEAKDEPKEPAPAKPLARIVKPSEIPSGTASVGDRKANPTGRLALSWQQPKVLLGQTVKGRYYITEMLGRDEVSISYLAEDKIVPNKKAFVRVFVDEDAADNSSDKIFAEERVSLSHINHPNIASVIDSGELPEGKPFIVSEYMEGKTVKDMLDKTGQFNALRTGRIIRQASYALSEAHQNGILHRNLKPENIFLTLSENGAEQVKLTNFGVLYDKINEDNINYKSPEQIEGKLSNYASDIYSLAIIAYQMLTNRLPFNASGSALLRAQRDGLSLMPTNFRLDVPPQVDEILEKALAFNPAGRFPKARDFGDAFYNALTAATAWEKTDEKTRDEEEKIEILPAENEALEEDILELDAADLEAEETGFDLKSEPQNELEQLDLAADDSPEEVEAAKTGTSKEAETLPWQTRSPDAVQTSPNWLLFTISAIGLIVFLGIWYYFLNRPSAPEFVPPATSNAVKPETSAPLPNQLPAQTVEIETPPIKRSVPQPPGTVYFENSRQDLEGEMAKNFVGFSLYYPQDWTRTESENNFLDVSKNASDGRLAKKVVITRYASRGTFNEDRAAFTALREKSDKDLSEILENYYRMSAGETTIQNERWKAFEVRFQGALKGDENKTAIWGRRFWIPVQRPGMKNGFVITILGTSLAPNVSSVDDVAADSELAQILETFEPS